jgi:hypothetical protein
MIDKLTERCRKLQNEGEILNLRPRVEIWRMILRDRLNLGEGRI